MHALVVSAPEIALMTAADTTTISGRLMTNATLKALHVDRALLGETAWTQRCAEEETCRRRTVSYKLSE